MSITTNVFVEKYEKYLYLLAEKKSALSGDTQAVTVNIQGITPCFFIAWHPV